MVFAAERLVPGGIRLFARFFGELEARLWLRAFGRIMITGVLPLRPIRRCTPRGDARFDIPLAR